MDFWWGSSEDDQKHYCTLYQCINNSGILELNGRNVIIGVGNAVIYETNNTRNTSICWKCAAHGSTFPAFGRFTDVARAWQHFSFLINPNEHFNGVWRFCSANFEINSEFRYSLNVNFYWNRRETYRKFRILKELEEVDWMKEGF